MPVSDADILACYKRHSRGIRGTARALGVSVIRVGKIVNAYLNR